MKTILLALISALSVSAADIQVYFSPKGGCMDAVAREFGEAKSNILKHRKADWGSISFGHSPNQLKSKYLAPNENVHLLKVRIGDNASNRSSNRLLRFMDEE